MKKFLKIFALAFVIEVILVFICSLASSFTTGYLLSFFLIVIDLISYPIILIDRTYPFYVMGPAYLALTLYIINISIHSIIIYTIVKGSKTKSI